VGSDPQRVFARNFRGKNKFDAPARREKWRDYVRGAKRTFFPRRELRTRKFFSRAIKSAHKTSRSFFATGCAQKKILATIVSGWFFCQELLAQTTIVALWDTNQRTRPHADPQAFCSRAGFRCGSKIILFVRFGTETQKVIWKAKEQGRERLAAQCCNLLPPRSSDT